MARPPNDDLTVLFGSSCNPPTVSHLLSAKALYRTLRPSQVWLLVSPQNPLKSTENMAPHLDRLAMAELMAAPYPWLRASSMELGLGTRETSQTLKALTYFYPDQRFIWGMGADNLAQFDQWRDWKWIIEHYPVAVLEREPYTKAALTSEAARFGAHLRRKKPTEILAKGGWCMLPTPDPRGMSASDIRAAIARGEDSPFVVPPVRDYIRRQGLYRPQTASQPA